MTGVLILLLVALLILAFWNFRSLHKLKGFSDTERELKDARFWELNYKIDYVVAVSAMGGAILVFLGYDSITSAKQQVTADLNRELIVIQEELAKTEKTIQTLQVASDSVSKIVSDSKGKVFSQLEALDRLQKKIDAINKKNIVQQGFYVVSGLTLLLDKDHEPIENRVYFKNLTTNSGDRLPVFTSPPLVIAISETDTSVEIFRIKLDSFEAYMGNAGVGLIPPSITYSIVIIGK